MKCIVCGNDIKENLTECPICGSQQMGTPIYNTQQFSNLQHQINNMHINNNYQQPDTTNNNYYGPNQPQPMVQQPYQQVQQNNYYQPTGYINPIQNGYPKPNPTKGKDIASLIFSGFGIYYSLCVFTVMTSGLNEFVSKLLSDPKYAEYKDVLDDKGVLTGSIVWPLYLTSIIALLITLSARKTNKTKLNTFALIASTVVLVFGLFSTYYIYNNL